MSVWSATTYKLDVAKAIFENVPTLVSKALGTTISGYLSPGVNNPLVQLDEESTWQDVAVLCSWDSDEIDPEIADVIQTVYGDVSRWILGGSALYQLIDAIRVQEFDCVDAYPYNEIEIVSSTVAQLVSWSTQVNPRVFVKGYSADIPSLEALGRRYENASEAFKYMRFAFKVQIKALNEIDQDRFFGAGDRIYYGHTIRNLCIMRGAKGYRDRGLIFLKAHLDLLIEALARIANMYYYMSGEYSKEEHIAVRVKGMLDMTITDAARARGKNADKVVQAYHKARMYAQMMIFENLHTGAIKEALEEFKAKGLHDVFSLDRYMTLVGETPSHRKLDVLMVYKWMIPPDFDSTYAFTELYDLHMHTRQSGADDRAPDKLSVLWRKVIEERKRNISAAYHARAKEWPIWGETIACRPNNLERWELHKLFAYHTYGDDIVAQVKDKATVSASRLKEISGRSTREESSFLLWFMANSGAINSEDDAQALLRGRFSEDNYARVAYKGEAHKPGSRLFFMAPPRLRILLGELEGNISQVASFYPGSLQGKDSHQKDEMLLKLFDIYEPPPDADASIDFETFIITFDLSKFSPKSNYAVTRDYHDFWATVFGYDPIRAMAKIGTESMIVHTQSNLILEYQNRGADLEGFRGRMMTLFHADMLGTACRIARDEGYITGKAVLAVFIDDGAVKIAAIGDGDEAVANANRFLHTMQEVYASAGQENHPNKTILSRVGGELLAEQFRYGVRLKCAIKAAMRLYPDFEAPACSITEEFDALFAAAQGAIKDQAAWAPTYRRYVTAFTKAICRWERYTFAYVDKTQLALKIVTPKAYGGFGLQAYQGLTSTTTLHMTAEGIGMLNNIARHIPSLNERIRRVITQPIMIRDPLSILRDPERVRIAGPILIENRLMMAIITKLEESNNPASKLMAGYRAQDLRDHAVAVAEALLGQETINITLLARAWECTPLAYVEMVVGKFRRAKTIVETIGTNKIARVRAKNKADIKGVLTTL